MLAASAGLRLLAVADEALAEPEREPLLADAERAVQEQGAGERVAADGVIEPVAERGVAMKGKEGHGWKVWTRRARW